MKRNILTGLIVIAFLAIGGANSYVVFTQVFGPIIPVITSVILTIFLTLFVSHLMSKVKFSDKEITDISNGMPDNFDDGKFNFTRNNKKQNSNNINEEEITL